MKNNISYGKGYAFLLIDKIDEKERENLKKELKELEGRLGYQIIGMATIEKKDEDILNKMIKHISAELKIEEKDLGYKIFKTRKNGQCWCYIYRPLLK